MKRDKTRAKSEIPRPDKVITLIVCRNCKQTNCLLVYLFTLFTHVEVLNVDALSVVGPSQVGLRMSPPSSIFGALFIGRP